MKNSSIGRPRQIFDALVNDPNFDQALAAEIKSQKRKVVDSVLYGTRLAGGKQQVRIFLDDDKKSPGVTNISSAKLEKDQVMVITGIQILSGIEAADNVHAVDFGKIAKEIANGEITFKVNGTEMLSKSSMSTFAKDQSINELAGYVELENPLVVKSQVSIDLQIETGAAIVAHTFIKVLLHGASVSM